MQTVIRVEKLSKTFNHNKALHAVDLTVRQGRHGGASRAFWLG